MRGYVGAMQGYAGVVRGYAGAMRGYVGAMWCHAVLCGPAKISCPSAACNGISLFLLGRPGDLLETSLEVEIEI